MDFKSNAFDLWAFRRDPDAVRYLLLHTSQEKADRWFNGGRFWQIPTDFVSENERLSDAVRRCLAAFALRSDAAWAVEHTYTIYNRRREDIELILVLAAEVRDAESVPLSWEHSECRWVTAEEARGLVRFRGLLEGLDCTCRYVTEVAAPLPELRIF